MINVHWAVNVTDGMDTVGSSNGNGFMQLDVNVTGVRRDPFARPVVFGLAQNYPNPFNPATQIEYDLAVASEVSVSIYDLLGREINSLVRGIQKSGKYIVYWNGTNDAGNSVSSGIYLYRIRAVQTDGKSFVATRKMILTR
jgi:hypothetical protein